MKRSRPDWPCFCKSMGYLGRLQNAIFRTRIQHKKTKGDRKNLRDHTGLWGKDEEQKRTEQKPSGLRNKTTSTDAGKLLPAPPAQEIADGEGKKLSKASIKCGGFQRVQNGLLPHEPNPQLSSADQCPKAVNRCPGP